MIWQGLVAQHTLTPEIRILHKHLWSPQESLLIFVVIVITFKIIADLQDHSRKPSKIKRKFYGQGLNHPTIGRGVGVQWSNALLNSMQSSSSCQPNVIFVIICMHSQCLQCHTVTFPSFSKSDHHYEQSKNLDGNWAVIGWNAQYLEGPFKASTFNAICSRCPSSNSPSNSSSSSSSLGHSLPSAGMA